LSSRGVGREQCDTPRISRRRMRLGAGPLNSHRFD
jgi:hypothetical protein